jgi:hypothetical protein
MVSPRNCALGPRVLLDCLFFIPLLKARIVLFGVADRWSAVGTMFAK